MRLTMVLLSSMFAVLLLAGPAFATATSCGGCHGSASKTNPKEWKALPLNMDNCTNTARGLHGTHMNYSSASYSSALSGGNGRGNCIWCHTPALNSYHPTDTHNNGYLNISTFQFGNLNSRGMRYNTTTDTCTNACHRNQAQTAQWGNYTSASMILNCRSCHDDITDKFALQASKHNVHLLSNCTTPAGVRMSAANNAGCVACHPYPTGEPWPNGKADDGSKKVYPHASDGTNVQSSKATVNGQCLSWTYVAGSLSTCTTNCHPRSNTTVNWNTTWAQGTGIGCDMCHYWAATTLDTANTGFGALGGSHSAHFKSGVQISCTACHPNHGTSNDHHGGRLPAQSYNARVNASLTYTRPAKSCSTTGNGCHGYATVYWGSVPVGCALCHKYPGATTGQGDWASPNGHAARYDSSYSHLKASGFNALTDTYAAITDPNKCGGCHSNAPASSAHNDGTVQVTSVGKGNGQCSGDYTITVTSSGSNVTCGSVKCHNGKTTPNWY